MAESVTVVPSGGVLVTESLDNTGTPLTPADNARPVTIGSGGPEVTFVGIDGVLWPGGVSPSGTLIADLGSYAWTGQDASLVVEAPASVAAGAGSYAWAGDDATPVQNHTLAGAGGSYAWTGQDATLTKSGGAAVTLNPSDKHANVTLSGGDLTSTNTTTRGNVRSTTSKSSGKFYFELLLTTGSNGYDHCVGVANSTASLTTGPGGSGGAHSVGQYGGDANIYINNASVGTGTTCTVTNRMCVAVDFDNNRIWYRTNSGNWNNNASNDPATNTGGVSIASITGPFFVIVSVENSGGGNGVSTINFGATAFTYTAPSGFGNW